MLTGKTWKIICLSFVSLLITGCAMKWQPAWQGGPAAPVSAAEERRALAEARGLFDRAESGGELLSAIGAYQKVIEINPDSYEALKMLSTQHILLGTAYTRERKEKSRNFRKAMSYAEQAMYTNRDFRSRVDSGARPWEAAEHLTAREVEAMFFWVTALQYEFKEGMTLAGKVVNLEWLSRALIFLDRIEEVAPDFGGGAVEFAKVICYYALPGWKGGSKVKGDQYMQKAVERADGWMLPRWARGKYYFPIKGEEELARLDLAWVAGQDPMEYSDPHPWKVHFQDDARQLIR